jgi:hypothetical protein
MKQQFRMVCFAVAALAMAAVASTAWPGDARADSSNPRTSTSVDLWEGMRDGQVTAKIVPLSDHQARIFITNKTDQPMTIQLPDAFAAVPLAQFGGGGGGGRAGGGGGGSRSSSSRSSSSSSQNQSSGGGFGGSGGGGGGGGLFSVPAEKTAEIDAATLCLDHGLRDPSPSVPYVLVPAEEHLDRPAVVELLKSFGRGELDHQAAQAAAWHLNNDMSWDDLSAQQTGTKRSLNRSPYFSRDQLKTAATYSAAAEEAAREKKEEQTTNPESKPKSDEESSEARSTQN